MVVSSNLKNLKPFHAEAVDIIEQRKDEIFANNGKNLEKWPKWQPLSTMTNEARAKRTWYYKKSPSSPWVLRWTGALQDNIRKITTETQWSMEFLSDYAMNHHRGWKNLPRRPLFDFNNKTNELIVKALQSQIRKNSWIIQK